MWDRVGATLLFGLAANTDNVSIGLAYGLAHRRIRWAQQCADRGGHHTHHLGRFGRRTGYRRELPRMPDLLGGSLLLLLAGWGLYAEQRGIDGSGFRALGRFAGWPRVGLAETLVLAAALSINNIGLAIASGIGGVNYRSAAVAIGGFSIVMLALGQAIGSRVVRIRLPRLARCCLNGNAVLALAGLFMLAGD